MPIDELLSNLAAHYRDRGFLDAELTHLQSTIRRKLDRASESVVFRGDLVLERKIEVLLDHFHLCDCSAVPKNKLNDADAILAFSFGYRTRTRGAGGAESRLPGPNNRALAEIAVQVKETLRLPLFAQFEIADAIDDYTDGVADYTTPREDMGTTQAIKYFLDHQKMKRGKMFKKVAVVAHQHHIGRCLILLREDFEIQAYPYGKRYSGYDPRECQARVTSPRECIVSDFVSMAARAKAKLARSRSGP
jgi:hypothetical protein